jgi:glucose repression regulatory protein TUP1
MFYGGLAPIDTQRSFQNNPQAKRAREAGSAGFAALKSLSAEAPAKQPKQGEGTPRSPSQSFPKDTKEVVSTVTDASGITEDKTKHEKRIGETGKDGKEDPGSGLDWIVGYNPGVQTNLNIDLAHSLDHSSVVCCVKFSNDGKCLSTGCNKSAQIYDVETGAKIHTFSEDPLKDGDLYIRSVCFSPDNKFLAAGAEDKTVKLWDIEQKRLHHTFTGHDLDIYSLDFSKDGNLIVSGSGDKKAKIWSVEKGECVFTLGHDEVGPKDGVTSVAFSPDGRLVAAGSLDRIVRLWDAQTGYFLERYEGHLDSVYSVAFSPDGKSLASGSLDKTLKLWDLSGSPLDQGAGQPSAATRISSSRSPSPLTESG